MSAVHENRNCIRHCIRVHRIKPIFKCRWWPAFRHTQLINIRAIMPASTMDHQFTIRNHCHSHQSFIRVTTITIRITIIPIFCHHRHVWITNCLHLICPAVIFTRIRRHIFTVPMSPHLYQFYHRLWPIQRLPCHRDLCHRRTHISVNITHFNIIHRRRHRTQSKAMRAPLNHRTIVLAVHRLSLTMLPAQYRSAAVAIIFARRMATIIITAPQQITTTVATVITTIIVWPQRMALNGWMAPVQHNHQMVSSTFSWIQINAKSSFIITIRCCFRHCQCPVQHWKSVCPPGKCFRRQRHDCCSWPCAGYDVWCHFKHFRRTINSYCYRFVITKFWSGKSIWWNRLNPFSYHHIRNRIYLFSSTRWHKHLIFNLNFETF